ncbi:ATP-binding protein [Hymenobacter oligotrophus]|uniref:histidine kinase n=1 Tax=Hymenobacter oligotrophus TaxID=2319843 RepID=A0A3B7QXB3_9BACT|nr:ATP-binding protein [Hymenobacter oligotrophus]AYA35972.1 ATP-binding protein [Hymenobacter oligotrophus]
MTSKRLEVGILLRLLGLAVLLLGAVLAGVHGRYAWLVGLVLLVGFVFWELTRYVTRGNQALADFLLGVKYRDFAQHYNENHPDRSLRPLHAAFNQLNSTYRQLSAEREAQYTYLQTLLELIDTGIISFDAEGQVEWLNDSFKQTLELPYLHTIQALERRQPVLYEAIGQLQPGASAIVKLVVGQRSLQLLLSSTRFRLQDKQFTLVAFKNVSQALDETQTEAWQKLLRVMTHEIMNSVAPIASLADSLRRHVQHALAQVPEPFSTDRGLLDDVEEGIGIIQNRSEGLLRFAEVYRNFSKITTPQLAEVRVAELLSSTYRLLQPQLAEQGIVCTVTTVPHDLTIQADRQLIEQVLINLIQNAAHAVQGYPLPRIQLAAYLGEFGSTVIEVADNGHGISADLLESIFIPFFTTRKNGTGIGLSLAKQIMRLHQGSIRVQSAVAQGSVFRLEFRSA